MPHSPTQQVVLERARRRVAILARHLRRHIGLGTGSESSRAGRVDNGLEGTGTVGRHNVHGSRDGAARGRDLGEGRAGLSDDVGHHVEGVFALAFGLSQAIGHGVDRVEDGGVLFGLAVRAGAGDGAALDAESSCVAACIAGLEGVLVGLFWEVKNQMKRTYSDCDFAVGRDHGGRSESEDEDLGIHFDGGSTRVTV